MPQAAPTFRQKGRLPTVRTPDTRYLQRGGKGRLYNDRRWQQESRKHILATPLCYLCREPIEVVNGVPVNACVDHLQDHKGDERLFWAKWNWASCHISPCHNRKKKS